tara:strand:+ start:664 stop:1434 length:771 start_codon:yes stop_codon:yes gene_type:complete
MKKILMFFLVANLMYGQNINTSDSLMTSVYNNLINAQGSKIHFEYLFENDAHQMNKPINGHLGLFSGNRFYLEFQPTEDNKVIQIYNGEALLTILPAEQEIQIDNLDQSKGIFIQDIFNNYQADFESKIKEQLADYTIITLTPKVQYHEVIFNECIDQLGLPACLKLPNQCKIGISPISKEQLKTCLKNNGGYQKNNILNIELTVNTKTLALKSITQLNKYNGKSTIQIKSIERGDISVLDIDNSIYSDFEIIDLR